MFSGSENYEGGTFCSLVLNQSKRPKPFRKCQKKIKKPKKASYFHGGLRTLGLKDTIVNTQTVLSEET